MWINQLWANQYVTSSLWASNAIFLTKATNIEWLAMNWVNTVINYPDLKLIDQSYRRNNSIYTNDHWLIQMDHYSIMVKSSSHWRNVIWRTGGYSTKVKKQKLLNVRWSLRLVVDNIQFWYNGVDVTDVISSQY